MEIDKSKFRKFTSGYTFKVLLLFFLVLLLLIPLAMIRGLIDDRSRTANSAEQGIMEAWGSELVAAGPMIAVPGLRTVETRTRSERDGERINIEKVAFTLVITPQELAIDADFKTEIRKRGIFSVPLFYGDLVLSGSFNPAQAVSSLSANEEIFWDQAELVVLLSSQKGIRRIDRATLNGQDLFFQPDNMGLKIDLVSNLPSYQEALYSASTTGIAAALPESSSGESTFDISIAIQGGRMVRFAPIGMNTRSDIRADWASPSFQGAYLPGSSSITDSGFEAAWDISYLSRGIPLFWKIEVDGKNRYFSNYLFGVDFFRAIDTYSLNTRAVKYAILFLIVPFLTLFLLEIFTKKKIHPVPYLLSGIANVIFYLLLLSFSEQMPFYLAYTIAALAVSVLLTLYSRSLLPSWNRSGYMGFVVTISYILLYAVLNAESYALLIGSVGAFAVVALVMFITRKLNWYGTEE